MKQTYYKPHPYNQHPAKAHIYPQRPQSSASASSQPSHHGKSKSGPMSLSTLLNSDDVDTFVDTNGYYSQRQSRTFSSSGGNHSQIHSPTFSHSGIHSQFSSHASSPQPGYSSHRNSFTASQPQSPQPSFRQAPWEEFSCKFCPSVFITIQALKSHEYIHTGNLF